MSKYSPRQWFLSTLCAAFLLSCFLLWLADVFTLTPFSNLGYIAYQLTGVINISPLPLILMISLAVALAAAFVAWVCATIDQLRMTIAAQGAEITRLKDQLQALEQAAPTPHKD